MDCWASNRPAPSPRRPGRSASAALLLACLLSYLAPATAWLLGERPLSPGEQDRAFELEVYHRVTERLGVEATRYVRITRFDNIFLITGRVRGEHGPARVEELALEVAGLRRESPDSPVVVPERTRDCGDRPVLGNVRRKQIVRGGEDCSALHAEAGQPATGRLYNHLERADADVDRQTAAADMLTAQARFALVEAGYPQALDRESMRVASQGSRVFVLMRQDNAMQSALREVLLRVPGVTDVQFYTS